MCPLDFCLRRPQEKLYFAGSPTRPSPVSGHYPGPPPILRWPVPDQQPSHDASRWPPTSAPRSADFLMMCLWGNHLSRHHPGNLALHPGHQQEWRNLGIRDSVLHSPVAFLASINTEASPLATASGMPRPTQRWTLPARSSAAPTTTTQLGAQVARRAPRATCQTYVTLCLLDNLMQQATKGWLRCILGGVLFCQVAKVLVNHLPPGRQELANLSPRQEPNVVEQ